MPVKSSNNRLLRAPFFQALIDDIDIGLIPELINLGFKYNEVIPRSKNEEKGRSTYIYHLFTREDKNTIISLEILISEPFDPSISISGSVYRVNPTDEDDLALSKFCLVSASEAARHQRDGLAKTVTLFRGHISPFHRWVEIGFSPVKLGVIASKKLPVIGRPIHFTMILLTIPFYALTLPIRKFALTKHEKWRTANPNDTATDRAIFLRKIKEEIPDMITNMREIEF